MHMDFLEEINWHHSAFPESRLMAEEVIGGSLMDRPVRGLFEACNEQSGERRTAGGGKSAARMRAITENGTCREKGAHARGGDSDR